tara:strand:- start:5272 stop:5508 length:237 start_codon:yes stop_codon:yes gene_type:complete
MKRKTAYNKIVAMIDEYSNTPVLSENSELKKDLDLDSLDIIDMAMEIEEETQRKIDTKEIKKWFIVGDVVDSYLNKKK